MKFEWEIIDQKSNDTVLNKTFRARVIGGWVIRKFYAFNTVNKISMNESMVFISDPNHEWSIE